MKLSMCRDEGSLLACQAPEGGLLLNKRCGPGGSELITPEKPVKIRAFTLSELETATGRFAKRSFLGKGSHGCLYKGVLKDGKIVSIKRQEYLQDEIAFNNELEILSTLHSHRFVNLLGSGKGPDAHEKLLVVEFMANGSLHDVLHHSPEPLSWAMRVQIALQVAKSILSLHSASPPVIHRDVKSANVMIDGKWNAKLGGFGLAFRGNVEDNRARAVHPSGTAGYMDTENETPSRLSTKVDVFSFGVLLLELLSGRRAIDVRHKPPNIIDWALPLIKQGKPHCVYDCKLEFQSEHAKGLRLLASIAARCVRRTSLRRPSMLNVVAGLQEVSKRIPMPKWIGLANVLKRTASWDIRHGRDVNSSPEFIDMMHSPRDRSKSATKFTRLQPIYAEKKTVDRGSKKSSVITQSKLGQSREEARLSSVDRLKACVIEQLRRPTKSKGKEEEQDELDNPRLEHPRDILDISLGGQKRTYNQWRNPVFDASRSPEKVIFPTDLSVRTTHRSTFSDGAIPLITAEARAARLDSAACLPHQALRVSTKIRSRSVKTSTRKSHIKTRASYEKEEALLPW